MRYPFILPAIAGLALALPAPQDIDLDMVLAAPDPTFSQNPTATAQIVTYDTASIIAEATAAASSVSIEISDVLSATAIVSNLKRGAATTCIPQPSGATSAPTYAPGPDTDNASAFLANGYYASVASGAAAPTGYSRTFVAQQGSNNAFGYLGFSTLDTYDVAKCLSRCSAVDGCVSVNIYFERDPSVDPNDASCSNPASITMIKCVYWASAVSQDTAVNKGQPRNQFTVAIAGSNGYATNQIATPDGFQPGVPYGKFAINAPYDAQGYNTFMGSKIFTSTWDVNSCARYCDAQTAYNKATAPKDGTPYKICNFFNTYVLTAHKADGSVVPQGQYCALYTEQWGSSYAVNSGQWRGQDQYLVSYSFGFAKSNPGVAPTVGDSQGAMYQARQDMTYFPSQLTSTFMPYCSSLLGYTIPLTTVTPSTTATPLTTTTTTVTSTTGAQNSKRDATTGVPQSLVVPWVLNYTATTGLERRATATVPAVLTKYPTAVQSGACSLIITKQTVASTITASPVTITAPTQVSTATSVVNVVATPVLRSGLIQVQNPSSGYDGQYINWNHGDYGLLIVQNQASLADSFSIDSQSHLVWGSATIVGNPVYDDITYDTILMTKYRDSYPDYFPNPVIAIDPSTGFISATDSDGRNVLQICAASTANVYSDSRFGKGPYLIVGSYVRPNCELAKLKFVSA